MLDPTRVLMAGDWHGNTAFAFDVIRQLPGLLPDESPRFIVHCGDFGVWPGVAGERYLHKLGRQLERAGAVLWFVDGNHEDHQRLAALPRTQDGFGMAGDRIFHIPRGRRWIWHGRTWLALGGGVSLDKAGRVEGKSWWAEEEITAGQAHHAIHDGPADVMVTHDCPSSVLHAFPPPPSWWAPADLARSDAHRERLQTVVDGVKPSHLIHGHLHRAYRRTVPMSHGDVQVTGLDCDGTAAGNWAVLNVETMEWGQAHA